MTAEPDGQPDDHRDGSGVARWWPGLRLATGIACLVLALLGLTGLVWLFGGTYLARNDFRTDDSALALSSWEAVPPSVVGPLVRDGAGATGPQPDPVWVGRVARATAIRAGARRPQPDPVWVGRVARTTGLPARALAAYAQASLLLSAQQPGCRVGWTTLAGLGQIESGHGTFGGSHLLEDGRPAVPIIGPALDGESGLGAIRATPDSTALDGDPNWAHAVGPMQFIPSTWQRWASDGDGDGHRDPNDIDDAAYAAARYLCASGGDLTTGAGWQRAIFSYNHSDPYTVQVLNVANRYALASMQN